MVNIKFAKTKKEAIIPKRSGDAAGLDVYACFEEPYIKIHPGETKLIPTGIKSIIDKGYFVLLEERGSTGSKGIKRSAGVIDSDFRGEWWVCIYNSNLVPLYIYKDMDPVVNESFKKMGEDCVMYPYSKAIAQGIVLPVPPVTIEEITEEELKSDITVRGEGDLGSSGN